MSAVKQGATQLEIPKHHPEEDPKNCTEWQIIDIPTVIFKQVLKRNQKHFGQAHGTPFTVSPLSNALQFTGEGPGTMDILSGAWEDSELSDSIQQLIQHLQVTDNMATTS
jgi:hypothetical protein